MTRADLVIVGAGAAGIGAGRAALGRGLDVRILEAKPRSGGRAWTDTTSLAHPFDLGCHWFHAASRNPLRAFADACRVSYPREPLGFSFHDGNGFLDAEASRAGNRAFAAFEQRLARAAADGIDCSIADVVDPADPFAHWFLRWTEHESAGSPSDISVADFRGLLEEREDYPIPSGYGSLIQRLARELPIELECPVTALDLGGRHVVVETPRGAIECRAVLLTVSVGVLAAEAIALRPAGWPAWKLRALDGLPLGSSTKVAIELPRRAFADVPAGCFVHCRVAPPANVSWHLFPFGFDMAVAYLGGRFSRELALAGDAALVDFAREHLVSLLGSGARRQLGRAVATPYDRDPWLRGGYSYTRVGHAGARAALAAPVDDRVFFAGEACSLDHPGTAHGAYIEGETAVARIAG